MVSMIDQRQVQVASVVPLMDRRAFAAAVGVTVDVIEGWVRRGYVLTHRVGKRSLIVVASLGAAEPTGTAQAARARAGRGAAARTAPHGNHGENV